MSNSNETANLDEESGSLNTPSNTSLTNPSNTSSTTPTTKNHAPHFHLPKIHSPNLQPVVHAFDTVVGSFGHKGKENGSK